MFVNGSKENRFPRRVVLPADWRESEVGKSKEVYVVKRKGYLKLIPKRPIDLTSYFDKIELDVDAIGSWSAFEKRIYSDRMAKCPR
ncbi:MAG: hypothetical protein H5T33_01660 [Candidatus Methanosuratus sp.]|nr:hypothetical protein [Candidatus Methanosuratincola sp.]